MSCCFLALYKTKRYDILGPCVQRTLQAVHLLLNVFVSNLLVVNRYSVSQITRFSYIFKFAIIALNYVYYVFDVTTDAFSCVSILNYYRLVPSLCLVTQMCDSLLNSYPCSIL